MSLAVLGLSLIVLSCLEI